MQYLDIILNYVILTSNNIHLDSIFMKVISSTYESHLPNIFFS